MRSSFVLSYALSFISLLIALIFLLAVPSFYIGRTKHGIASVSVSENAIAGSARSESFTNVDVDSAAALAHSLKHALCSSNNSSRRGSGPHAAARWFALQLKSLGMDAEWRAVHGGGAFTHGVLRAGAGAAGTAALVYASAGPTSPGDVWARRGESQKDICDEEKEENKGYEAPHGALLLLAVARVLRQSKWRNSDFSFVFFFDTDSKTSGDTVCSNSSATSDINGFDDSNDSNDSTVGENVMGDDFDDVFTGFAGQAGCYDQNNIRRGSSNSLALSAWARAATADTWRDSASVPAIARAWHSLRLFEWASLLFSPWSILPSEATLKLGGRGVMPLRELIGPIRAALIIDAPAGARGASTEWSILTAGANGRQPDSDLYATLSRVLSGVHGVALVGTRVGKGVNEGGGGTLAASLIEIARAVPSVLTPIFNAAAEAAASAETLLWGPDGAHGEILAVALPAITLRSMPGGRVAPLMGAGALGTMVLLTARAFDGLDERLHAGARHYIFTSPSRYIPLPEFVIPLAIAHVPLFLIGLGIPPPSARAWAGALGAAAVALLGGTVAYVTLMHASLTASVSTIARITTTAVTFVFGLNNNMTDSLKCPAHHNHTTDVLYWAIFISVTELVFAPLLLPLVARTVRGIDSDGDSVKKIDGDPNLSNSALSRAVSLLTLVAHGIVFFPLLYYNAPLATLSTFVAVPILVTAAAFSALPKGFTRTALRGTLWLLISPVNILALAIASGHACTVVEMIVNAVNLHTTYGTSQVPVALFLWLPLHALLVVG